MLMLPELVRWTPVAAMAAALLRWPRPGAPFWSLAAGRPFVLARADTGPGRFREACPG